MKKIIFLMCLFFIFFMSIENWGALQKSATSDETIEQAIARLIAIHEGDSTSHLGAGESLQAHKNADVIDHPAQSLVPDKITSEWFDYVPSFDSLDFAGILGGVSFSFPGFIVQASSSTPVRSALYLQSEIFDAINPFNKEFLFSFVASISDLDSDVDYMAGFANGGFSPSSVYNGNGVYLFVDNNVPYFRVKTSGGTVDLQITGISLSVPHNFRFHAIPADGKVYFYIDGVLFGSSNFPATLPTAGHNFYFNIGSISGSYDSSLLVSAFRYSFKQF